MGVLDNLEPAVEFGRFHVLRRRRELLIDGKAVELGTRAFDILTVLIEARGALVTKDELLKRVWPSTVIEENTLQSHVHALRRALGKDRDLILTESGRGYRFIGEINSPPAEKAVLPEAKLPAAAAAPRGAPQTNLPLIVYELIGRETELAEVLELAGAHRLVTLTGAGGIGKTRLALEAARRLLPELADGVWLAELAPLSDPRLVPVTVASALGLELKATQVFAKRAAAALSGKQLIILLDNCEHVVEVAAHIAETLLHAVAGVRVLATSREPLGAEGEFSYRVPPLEIPPLDARGAEDALRYGSVQLFVARAQATDPHFALDDRAAATVGAICRRLDGIPLALELAAARTAVLGINGLATLLNDSFRLLASGRRTGLPRHKTLHATFEWSYGLLADAERTVLRRLAVFAGGFTLEAAGAVVTDGEIAAAEAIERVTDLIAKSLVTADVGGAVARYRLLETTRGYALEKLAESGELEALARRHADYYRTFFERAEAAWEKMRTADWMVACAPEIDNVRTALGWAFAAGGDVSIGVALTAASVTLWLQLSLLDECRQHVERALASLDAASGRWAHHEMLLQAALALSLMHTKGPVDETAAAWTRALELAESLDHAEYRLRATYGLWLYRLTIGEYRIALALVHMFRARADNDSDPGELPTGLGMTGISLHYLGDQTNARAHIERMLARSAPSYHRSLAVRFGLDQRVGALVHLAPILWLQGFPDQARRVALAGVDEARMVDHVTSICFALANGACPLGILIGDLSATERLLAMLIDRAEKHALGVWQAYGIALSGWVSAKRGNTVEGVRLLGAGLRAIRKTRFAQRLTMYLGGLAEALGEAGQVAEGLATIDESLRRSERNDERWNFVELLRIKGELLRRHDGAAPGAAEEILMQALSRARRQGTLSWELRTAMSLARLRRDDGRIAEARELLAPIYGRFTEGFETADLTAAQALMHELR